MDKSLKIVYKMEDEQREYNTFVIHTPIYMNFKLVK